MSATATSNIDDGVLRCSKSPPTWPPSLKRPIRFTLAFLLTYVLENTILAGNFFLWCVTRYTLSFNTTTTGSTTEIKHKNEGVFQFPSLLLATFASNGIRLLCGDIVDTNDGGSSEIILLLVWII